MVFNSSAEIFSKFTFNLFHGFWFKVAAVAEAVEMSAGLFTVPGEGPFPCSKDLQACSFTIKNLLRHCAKRVLKHRTRHLSAKQRP